MKKLIFAVATITTLVGFTACSEDSTTEPAKEAKLAFETLTFQKTDSSVTDSGVVEAYAYKFDMRMKNNGDATATDIKLRAYGTKTGDTTKFWVGEQAFQPLGVEIGAGAVYTETASDTLDAETSAILNSYNWKVELQYKSK